MPLDRRSKTLNIALEHACRAVELDAKGDSTLEAIETYGQSTSLLMCVIESLKSEASAPEGERTCRREELERLIAIHDSYRNRMGVLCGIFGIPMPEETKARL